MVRRCIRNERREEMGYYVVPNLKNKEIVCQKPCSHTDCSQIRKEWAGATCCDCGKPLKAGMPFYYKDYGVHQCVVCVFKGEK